MHIHIYTCTYTHTYIHTYIQIHILCIYIHTCTCTYTYIYIYIYTYTNTYIHTYTGEDVKLLQALAKAVDVSLHGVDLLQKKCNRLRIRYTLIKSHFTERDGLTKLMPRCVLIARLQHHHMSVLMQRQARWLKRPLYCVSCIVDTLGR